MPRRPMIAWILTAVLLAVPATAQTPTTEAGPTAETPAGLEILAADGVDVDQFLWTRRVLVVFADTPADPRYIQQMQLLNERPRDLTERDVVVLTDTAPTPPSEIRTRLRPRGFALVMIDKDGEVKLRKPSPWSTREIGRSIDKTPLRRQEIRDRSTATGG